MVHTRADRRWGRRRVLHVALVGLLGAGAGLGLGLVQPAQAAQALVAPPVLPVALSSELAALIGPGGFAAGEAAAAAGTAGVAATGAAGLAAAGGSIAVAGAGAFVVTAGSVGVITRAVGGSTEGLCAAGSFVGALYGDDCAATPMASQITIPNADQSPTAVTDQYCFAVSGEPVCLRVVGMIGPLGRYNDFFANLAQTGLVRNGAQYRTPSGRLAFLGWSAYKGTDEASSGLTPYDRQTLTQEDVENAVVADATLLHSYLDQGYRVCIKPSAPTADQETAFNVCAGGGSGQLRIETPNPARTFETVVTGSDGAKYRCRTAAFHQDDATLPKPCSPTLPDGVTPDRVQVDQVTAGGARDSLTDLQVSDAYQAARQAYPECATGTCRLQVYKGDDPCTVGADGCTSWKTEPSSRNISCRYGTHTVDLNECNVLARYYQPAAQKAGKAYSDPRTGAEVETLTSRPTAGDPATDPTGDPTTGPDGSPCAIADLFCVVKAAFIPTPGYIDAKGKEMEKAWNRTTPARTAIAIAGFMPTEYPEGCSGLNVDLGPIFSKLPGGPAHKNIQLANACNEPFKTIAALCNLGLVVVFGVGCVLACSRHIGALVNARGAGDGG